MWWWPQWYWMLVNILLNFEIAWSMSLFLTTCCHVKPVLLAATYQLISCWKTNKHKLFYDENLPAGAFESKVFETENPFPLKTLKNIGNIIPNIVLFFCCFYREKEAPRLTESGFQFLVCLYITSEPHLIAIFLTRYHSLSVQITADGYKCTTLVHHQRIYF